MSVLDGERFDLQAKHFSTAMWLIALIASMIASLFITTPALIGDRWYLLTTQMAFIIGFQVRSILLKRKIKKLDKEILVREILES
jgi:hypothetical protein